MKIKGYEIITEWQASNCGETALAKSFGKKYFIKKYKVPVYPENNGSFDAKTLERNRREFNEYIALRKKINSTIRAISGAGGNLVVPKEEFVYDNHYYEVAELVPDVVEDKDMIDTLSSLSNAEKEVLMCTLIGAIDTIHNKGIVHSDLKLKNVLLVKNERNTYVAKIIDFDNSFLLDSKPCPEDIGGSIDYCSPEIAYYANLEEDWDEAKEAITAKSDIFSLGLIFHFYLTGELPKAKTMNEYLRKRAEKGKAIYCWNILLNDCELQLSDKIDDEKYISLISDMLMKNPEERPSASEVLIRLKSPSIPKKTVATVPSPSTDVAAVKIETDTILTTGFADAWDMHDIVFDIDKIKSKGYVASEQKELMSVQGYYFYTADGATPTFISKETLLVLGLANKKTIAPKTPVAEPEETGFCEPWVEHNMEFDKDKMKEKGFVGIERTSINDTKGYNLIDSKGNKKYYLDSMLVIFKMATRKK